MSDGEERADPGSAPATLEAAHLMKVLEHRTTISAAVGILMERYTTDYDTASRRLSRASSMHHVTVYELARQLVRRGWAADL